MTVTWLNEPEMHLYHKTVTLWMLDLIRIV